MSKVKEISAKMESLKEEMIDDIERYSKADYAESRALIDLWNECARASQMDEDIIYRASEYIFEQTDLKRFIENLWHYDRADEYLYIDGYGHILTSDAHTAIDVNVDPSSFVDWILENKDINSIRALASKIYSLDENLEEYEALEEELEYAESEE